MWENGEAIREDDFINFAQRDGTPSDDTDRLVKLESNGRLHPYFTKHAPIFNAGATINGGTTPVPVYQNKSDNEVYACDANDNSKYKFLGFGITNGTDGNPIIVQVVGIVSGFTGLVEGEKYYVQDTAGTIGTSPGTQEILVGVAISETELLIQKGQRHATGTTTITATGDTTITTGFRASKITLHARRGQTNGFLASDGGWSQVGGNRCVRDSFFPSDNPGSGSDLFTDRAFSTGEADSSNETYGTISSVTDTTFVINCVNFANGQGDTHIYWEAEGEL